MNLLAAWLATIAVHGTLLLLLAYALERTFPALRRSLRELLWRSALFGAVLTATLQLAAPELPAAGALLGSASPRVVAAPSASAQEVVGIGTPRVVDVRESKPPMQPQAEVVPAATPHFATKYTLFQIGTPLARWIVALWLAGAALALLRTAASWRRLRRALAHAQPLMHAELAQDLAELTPRAFAHPPRGVRLLGLDAIPSPLAASGSRIVLPGWALASLDRAKLRAMLAHELAHLARRDPQWKLVAALWRCVFWFVPVIVLAQRRLDDLAELACDAHAASYLGSARGLAECLAVCAEHHVRGRHFALAPAMASRPSSLVVRIERLLEGVRMETTAAGPGARVFVFAALLACGLVLPAVGIDAVAARAAGTARSARGTGSASGTERAERTRSACSACSACSARQSFSNQHSQRRQRQRHDDRQFQRRQSQVPRQRGRQDRLQ